MNRTNKQHTKDCKDAGCMHPAVYTGLGKSGRKTMQGWCALCRKWKKSNGNNDLAQRYLLNTFKRSSLRAKKVFEVRATKDPAWTIKIGKIWEIIRRQLDKPLKGERE
jgi:hypothetical protein